MKKFSNAENWEIYCTSQTKDEKQQAADAASAAKKAVEDFVLTNLHNLRLRFVSEEGETESSFSELETAIKLASTSELQAFLGQGRIPFEDGTIIVSIEQKKEKTLALCEGRHEMPAVVEGAIFGNSINPLDIDGLEKTASEKLADVQHLTLYVTGLTVALVAVINVCRQNNVELTLMHFDRVSKSYYEQAVK